MKNITAGIEIIKELFNLSLAFMEHDGKYIPQEFVDSFMNRNYNALNYENNIDTISNKNYSIDDVAVRTDCQTKNSYNKYILDHGWSFEDLISNCFKVDKKLFNIKIIGSKIVIKSDFYAEEFSYISNELTRINKNYIKQKDKLALTKKNSNPLKNDDILHVANYVKTQQFII